MNFNEDFEYTVKKKSEGAYRRNRILMILFYIAFGLIFFFGLAAAHLYQLMAFVVLVEWIVIFFTWRYVSIEYKYSMSSGKISFFNIYGEKAKKTIIEATIKDFVQIAPARDEFLSEYLGSELQIYDFTPYASCNDKYFAVLKAEDEKLNIIYFQATENALKIFKYYNSKTIVEKTQK